MNECCNSCPEVQETNIPGPEGADGGAGTDGADGKNAFTVTTADFETPLVGQNVTIEVLDSSWMTIGQKIITQGPATLEVVSKPTATSVIATFMGYVGDVAEGATVSTGSSVSPSGVQGPDETLLPEISSYAVGGAQAVTGTHVQALTVSVTLPEAKKYLLIPSIRFDFSIATFADTANLTAKLRRTNNTAGDLANGVAIGKTGVQSVASHTMPFPQLPSVVYNATAGDIIQLFVLLSATPYSGAVNVVEASILAIPLF